MADGSADFTISAGDPDAPGGRSGGAEIFAGGEFDLAFFVARYPELFPSADSASREAAEAVYLALVRDRRLDPNPGFSEQRYLERYPDVAEAVAAGVMPSGYLHYLGWGCREGRSGAVDVAPAAAPIVLGEPGIAGFSDSADWHGAVTRFEADGIAGWIAPRGDAVVPSHLLVFQGERLVAECVVAAQDGAPWRFTGTLAGHLRPEAAPVQLRAPGAGEGLIVEPLMLDLPVGTVDPRIAFQLDDMTGEWFAGWTAWLEAPPEDDRLALTLTLAGIELGAIARDFLRTDVDEHLGYAGARKGFLMRAAAFRAFLRLGGFGAAPAVLHVHDPEHGPLATQPVSAIGPRAEMVTLAAGLAGMTLVDAAFATRDELRLTIARAEEATAVGLRAWQGLGGRLVPCRVEPVHGVLDDRRIHAVALDDPFAPVLLVLHDASGVVRAIDLMPFPSLCRGGPHHPELRAAGIAAADPVAIARLSTRLANRWEGRGAPVRIAVETAGVNGGEMILDADVLRWLEASAGAAPSFRVAADDAVARACLDGTAAEPLIAEAAPADAVLPIDAIPTLALVTGAVSANDDALVAAPFLARERLREAAWAVSLPPVGDWFGEVQPRAGAWYPRVRRGLANGGFAALRLVAPVADGGPEPLFPLMRETPLLRGASEPVPDDCLPVSVCVAAHPDPGTNRLFVEALCQQTVTDRIELVVAVADARARADLGAVLAEWLPERHRLVDVAPPLGTAARLNRAAGAARHPLLLFAGVDIVMHDPALVAVLARMLRGGPVASATAALVRAAPDGFAITAAGVQLGAVSAANAPNIAYQPIGATPGLVRTTYPVVAAPDQLLLVDAARFAEFGGFDEDLAEAGYALGFGLRAISHGYVTLCTNSVSAFTPLPAGAGAIDVDLARALPELSFAALAAAAVHVRRVA